MSSEGAEGANEAASSPSPTPLTNTPNPDTTNQKNGKQLCDREKLASSAAQFVCFPYPALFTMQGKVVIKVTSSYGT